MNKKNTKRKAVVKKSPPPVGWLQKSYSLTLPAAMVLFLFLLWTLSLTAPKPSTQDNRLQTVLGTATKNNALSQSINSDRVTQLKLYWQEVVRAHPDYRDAWAQLLFLSYNEGDVVRVREYKEHLQALDPNYIRALPTELQTL